jgi:hypothetical protein
MGFIDFQQTTFFVSMSPPVSKRRRMLKDWVGKGKNQIPLRSPNSSLAFIDRWQPVSGNAGS